MIQFVSGRTLVAVLMISASANMFLGGLALSHLRPPPRHEPLGILDDIADQLPPEDAEILRSTIDEKKPFLIARGVKSRSFPERLQEALRSEPFDPQAVADLFENGIDEGRIMAEVVIEAASRMSPEGRRRWAAFRP